MTSSTAYLRSGTTYTPTAKEDLDVHELLPAGNYIIVKCPNTGVLRLSRVADFTTPPKLYGDIQKTAARIINTYHSRTVSTGVLMAGAKGSGKTQLLRLIAAECAATSQMPTIIITTPWQGDQFFKLIQSIEQECIVVFDEFEKVYDCEEQERVLTLLDGIFQTKKLFIITSNRVERLDENLLNRPGRMFYMLEYEGLANEFIHEYCADVLDNKDHIGDLVALANTFAQFNFDMLKSLVEECNRYKEAPGDAIKMLNVKQSQDQRTTYDIMVYLDDAPLNRSHFSPAYITSSPLFRSELEVTIHGEDNVNKIGKIPHVERTSLPPLKANDEFFDDIGSYSDREEHTVSKDVKFGSSNIVSIDKSTGSIKYEVAGLTIVYTKRPLYNMNIHSLIA